jgi:TetR/AcrR family tetracycline transcriptional repressor
MLLRRPDVVRGALDLLDAEGLDGLTMRRLGAALNVQGGALYRHFPSKEALLDAMAEELMAAVGDPVPGVPWPEAVRIMAERVRAALLTRRDGARVVAGTYVSGPHTTAAGRRSFELLCEAGFDSRQALTITFALFHFVLGHTIEEQALTRLGSGEQWAARIESQDGFPDPYTEALQALARRDPGERFRYGLQVFIDGMRAQHGA